MAANIPFTPSTIPYESYDADCPPRRLCHETASLSVLDALKARVPLFAELIRKANRQRSYATTNPVTVFVSESFNPITSVAEADVMCRSLTVPLKLTLRDLRYSPKFVLRTLATPYDLLVSTVNEVTRINGNAIVETIECENGVIHVLN